MVIGNPLSPIRRRRHPWIVERSRCAGYYTGFGSLFSMYVSASLHWAVYLSHRMKEASTGQLALSRSPFSVCSSSFRVSITWLAKRDVRVAARNAWRSTRVNGISGTAILAARADVRVPNKIVRWASFECLLAYGTCIQYAYPILEGENHWKPVKYQVFTSPTT